MNIAKLCENGKSIPGVTPHAAGGIAHTDCVASVDSSSAVRYEAYHGHKEHDFRLDIPSNTKARKSGLRQQVL